MPVVIFGNSWKFDLGHPQPGNFATEKLWEPCRFSWKLVGDEDLKSLGNGWECADFQCVRTLFTFTFYIHCLICNCQAKMTKCV